MAGEMIKPDVQKNIVETAKIKLDGAENTGEKKDKFEKKDGTVADLNIKEIKDINAFLANLSEESDKATAMKALQDAAKEVGEKNFPALPDFFIMSWIMSESQDVAKDDLVAQLKTAIGATGLDEKSRNLVTYDKGLLDSVIKYVVAGSDKATIKDVQIKLNAFKDIALGNNSKYKPEELWDKTELADIQKSLNDESLKGFLQDGKLKEDDKFGMRTLTFLEIYMKAMKNMGVEKKPEAPKVEGLNSKEQEKAAEAGKDLLTNPEKHLAEADNLEAKDVTAKLKAFEDKAVDNETAHQKVGEKQIAELNKTLGLTDASKQITKDSTWAEVNRKTNESVWSTVADKGAVNNGLFDKDGKIFSSTQFTVDVPGEHGTSEKFEVTVTSPVVAEAGMSSFNAAVKSGDKLYYVSDQQLQDFSKAFSAMGLADNKSLADSTVQADVKKNFIVLLKNSGIVRNNLLGQDMSQVIAKEDLNKDDDEKNPKDNNSKAEKEKRTERMLEKYLNLTEDQAKQLAYHVEVHSEDLKNPEKDKMATFTLDWEGGANRGGGNDALVTINKESGEITLKTHGMKLMEDPAKLKAMVEYAKFAKDLSYDGGSYSSPDVDQKDISEKLKKCATELSIETKDMKHDSQIKAALDKAVTEAAKKEGSDGLEYKMGPDKASFNKFMEARDAHKVYMQMVEGFTDFKWEKKKEK